MTEITYQPMVMGRPSDREIDDSVAAILRSAEFSENAKARIFLRYIVENRDHIPSGLEIAINAFGMPPDFNPKKNSIVRTAAAKTRALLVLYYEGSGERSPLRITVQLGSYSVEYRYTDQKNTTTAKEPKPEKGSKQDAFRSSKTIYLLVFVAATIITLITLARYTQLIKRENFLKINAVTQETKGVRQVSLRVRSDTDHQQSIAIENISRHLVDVVQSGIALFGGIAVIPSNYASQQTDYDMTLGIVQTDRNNISINATLSYVPTGEVVWSKKTGDINLNDRDAIKNETSNIISTVGIYSGVIFNDLFERYSERNNDEATICVTKSYHYLKAVHDINVIEVRDCLEHILKSDPDSQTALSTLAFVDEIAYVDAAPGSNGDADIKRALSIASRAYQVNPIRSRYQVTMAYALYFSGRVEEGSRLMAHAFEVNPYNLNARAEIGSEFIRAGDFTRGLDYMVPVLDPKFYVPRRFDPYAALGYYMLGDYKRADRYAGEGQPGYRPFAYIMRTLICAKAGDQQCVADAKTTLVTRFPAYVADLNASFAREQIAPHVAAVIFADLRAAKF